MKFQNGETALNKVFYDSDDMSNELIVQKARLLLSNGARLDLLDDVGRMLNESSIFAFFFWNRIYVV
jgi:hypothetical protein